ncbi:hypothetical protein LCGC14_0275660 [marine sediment metagenome]|uniref:Uncharacterized protein n=1 Tax=marine sediment metagenome TaxID=412755 RepID=A0A0F9WIJ5_9ZZZZ
MAKQKIEFYRSIKAIRTRYEGRTYRSRTEARWAVFFSLAGIPFQFEKEHSPTPWLVGEKPPPELVRSSKTGDVIHPSPVIRMLRPDWPSRRRPLWYLPDYYLLEQELFLEIKPLMYDSAGDMIMPPMEKQRGLTEYHQVEIITLCGIPGEYKSDPLGRPPFIGIGNKGKRYMTWARCSVCNSICLAFNDQICCRNCWEIGQAGKDPEVQQALREARLWNFRQEEG